MDAYDFEKLAKDLAMAELRGSSDHAEAAAGLLRRLLLPAVSSTAARQDPSRTVRDCARGIFSGLLLLEMDLPSAAAALLGQTAALAEELHLDPAEFMTWTMQGLAPVCRVAGEKVREAVQEAIEARFMGAGEVFARADESPG